VKKLDSLETRFGTALTALQQESPSTQSLKRVRLLRTMERFSGDVDYVRKYLQKIEERQKGSHQDSTVSQQVKYANQLAELVTAGINVNSPCVLIQLEKHHGDVNKVPFNDNLR
jgi:hypothetical protein